MSLFVCEECDCIENTAASRFWFRDAEADGKALCSLCDPKTQKWHGLFPRMKYDPAIHKPAYIDGEWVRAAS